MKRKTTRKASPRGPSLTKKAEQAGEQYAQDQLQGDYFMDWVRDQLLEASRMPPEDVLPLETQQDALVIAKNMLQQLKHDTLRDLRANEIESLIGINRAEPDDIDSFFVGFENGLNAAHEWLADELLEIKSGMGSRRVGETRRLSETMTPRQKNDFNDGWDDGYRFREAPDGTPRSPEHRAGWLAGMVADRSATTVKELHELRAADLAAYELSRMGGGRVREAKTLREGGKQATKPGKHGTLRLWKITYKDSNDPGFGEDSLQKWAYDKQAAWDAFNEQVNSEGESWEIVKIEPVLDTGPRRLSRQK